MGRIRQSGPHIYPHVSPGGEEQGKICERIKEELDKLTEVLKELESHRDEVAFKLMDAEREMVKVCEEAAMTNECWEVEHLVMSLRDDIDRMDRDIESLEREIEHMERQMEGFGCWRTKWEE